METFLVASLGGPIVVPPSDPREGVIGPYIQIQSTNWVEKLAPAEPLALEESLWRAAARSVTIICTIRKVQKMPPSAHVPTIGTGELARGGRCW